MADNANNPNPCGRPRLTGITRNSVGQLVAQLSDHAEPVVDVRVARCFPWSRPERYISIRDREGQELVLLENMDCLDEAGRCLLNDELRDKVFNPVIKHIMRSRSEFDVCTIYAETDRGEVAFQIRNRDDVRVLGTGRALFKDVDGNTYEIPDLAAMDRHSRKLISHYF